MAKKPVPKPHLKPNRNVKPSSQNSIAIFLGNARLFGVLSALLVVGGVVIKELYFTQKTFRFQPIERVSELSYEDFFVKYAKPFRPVIVSNYSLLRGEVQSWTVDHIAEKCRDAVALLQKRNNASRAWAKLDPASNKPFIEFAEYYKAQMKKPKELQDKNPLYLFDWSLGNYCPELAKELTIPKYFAGDYFKRRVGKHAQVIKENFNNWPSLFMGNSHASSALHIDFANTSFWMTMITGHKKWYVLDRKHQTDIYRIEGTNTFEVDLMEMNRVGPDFTTYPLLKDIVIYEAILGPGDVLFVPAGCPHQVANIDDNIAIAGNMVDESNFDPFLVGFKKFITQNGREPTGTDKAVMSHYKSKEFQNVRGMDPDQSDVSWEEYNSWPKSTPQKYTLH